MNSIEIYWRVPNPFFVRCIPRLFYMSFYVLCIKKRPFDISTKADAFFSFSGVHEIGTRNVRILNTKKIVTTFRFSHAIFLPYFFFFIAFILVVKFFFYLFSFLTLPSIMLFYYYFFYFIIFFATATIASFPHNLKRRRNKKKKIHNNNNNNKKNSVL